MNARQPSPDQQLQFLFKIQRLLNEGSFVATYKFALLSALADLCIETGEDTGAELTIPTRKISEKFITFYWRQSRPFMPSGHTASRIILRQNTGIEAGVIRILRQQLDAGIDSLNALRRNETLWTRIVTEIDHIVRQMPLWKLQTIGHETLEFLYSNTMRGTSIRLKPGIMFCFRAFHVLITDIVRGAWVRYVRRYNQAELGAPSDLDEFLFGSERVSLAAYLPVLREIQSSRCFYCGRGIRAETSHIDHFIPWVTYPINLGHNFVLTDSACNTAKSDHLAAQDHLEHWVSRNRDLGSYLGTEFDRIGVTHDLCASTTIAEWAYNRAFAVGAETFRARGVFEPLPDGWRKRIGWCLDTSGAT